VHGDGAGRAGAPQLLRFAQGRVELSAWDGDETESREEPVCRRRKQVDVPNAALPRHLERRSRQLLPQPLPAARRGDRHGTQQPRRFVDLYRGTSDHLPVLTRNECRMDMLLDAGERQRARVEQRQHFG
jgi:hypothetical protein